MKSGRKEQRALKASRQKSEVPPPALPEGEVCAEAVPDDTGEVDAADSVYPTFSSLESQVRNKAQKREEQQAMERKAWAVFRLFVAENSMIPKTALPKAFEQLGVENPDEGLIRSILEDTTLVEGTFLMFDMFLRVRDAYVEIARELLDL